MNLAHTSKKVCHIFDVHDIVSQLQPLFKFFGFFEIILGFVLCFFGSRFILYCIAALVFVTVNVIIMGIAYNFNVFFDPQDLQPNVPVIVGLLLLSIIAGSAIAFYSLKFAKNYSGPILAGWCGFALSTLLLSPIKAIGNTVRLVLIIISVIACIYIGKKYNKHIKSIGTAFIGSFFMMHGIGAYAGGFPSTF